MYLLPLINNAHQYNTMSMKIRENKPRALGIIVYEI